MKDTDEQAVQVIRTGCARERDAYRVREARAEVYSPLHSSLFFKGPGTGLPDSAYILLRKYRNILV